MRPRYSKFDEEDVASFMTQGVTSGRRLVQISLTKKDNEPFASPVSVNAATKMDERFAYLLTPDSAYEKQLEREQKTDGGGAGHSTQERNNENEKIKLWVFFGGNAQTALSWMYILHKHLQLASLSGAQPARTRREAYLLVDYPGYGQNAGDPGRHSITEDAKKAIQRAVNYLQTSYPNLCSPTHTHGRQYVEVGLFGHSIGCAAALDVAATTEMDRVIDQTPSYEITHIVLSAPFTSLLEMARRIVGRLPFLSVLLRHDFDNIASLNSFATNRTVRTNAPSVRLDVVHGTRDGICPHEMGVQLGEQAQRLAHEAPGRISSTFTSIEGGDHNEILFGYWDLYMSKMHIR